MQANEIHVGKAYTNGRGGIRRVLAAGTNLYVFGRRACDAVRYEVLASGTQEKVGWAHNITRAAFARWAKSEIEISLSQCCGAPCRVEGRTTHYNVCTRCGQPCDPKSDGNQLPKPNPNTVPADQA